MAHILGKNMLAIFRKYFGPRGADNKVEEVLWSELYAYVDELV